MTSLKGGIADAIQHLEEARKHLGLAAEDLAVAGRHADQANIDQNIAKRKIGNHIGAINSPHADVCRLIDNLYDRLEQWG